MDKQVNCAQAGAWPYPVRYGEEHTYTCDVLIVGGGMAGCFAAIHAARRGARVVVAEKGDTRRSGAAGAGIDHWANVYTNPCSRLTPDEMIEFFDRCDPYVSSHVSYITMNESYPAMLDLEEMGVEVRDNAGEFAGAPFRDDETKLMFAYDYDNKFVARIHGADLKPALHREMQRLGVTLCQRVMVTGLLNEGGQPGNRVVGAVGFHTRTGEFYIFRAKATILSTAKPLRLWDFSTEQVGSNASHDDPNCAGDGAAMAWRAGATLMMMERSHSSMGGRRYPAYGTGNAHNTWYPCTIVDANGKEIPWVDRDGRVLTTVAERNRCAPGQKFFLHGPGAGPYETQGPALIPDLPQRIMAGEYKLPFYADLPSMPETERRAIFGLMIGNEGKTRTPVLGNLTRAGFDPKRDMLQANVLPPQYAGIHEPWWDVKADGIGGPNIRETSFMNYGGLVVDWDLRTTLDGLFAAGNQIAGAEGAANGAANGRYCGRSAAAYAREHELAAPDRGQIDREKARVYAPVSRSEGYGWKEVQIGLCRIMQDYCGDCKSTEVLETGLWWLNSIRENEIARLCARNPHELARALECEIRLTVGEIIMHQCLMRPATCKPLGFERLEAPEHSDNGGNFITITRRDGKPVRGEIPFRYWLSGSNYPTYRENYLAHCRLEEVSRP